MKSYKSQTFAMIGLSLIVIAAILFYIGFSQPRIYEENSNETYYNTTESEEIQSDTDDIENDSDTTQEDATSASSSSSNSSSKNSSSSSLNSTTKSSNSVVATTSSSSSVVVNLNTATVDQLTQINGLGEKKASAIIEYREYIGGYTDVSQIKNISGIGDTVYEQIAPYLTVE